MLPGQSRDTVLLKRRCEELRRAVARQQTEVEFLQRRGLDATAARAALAGLTATLESLELRLQASRGAAAYVGYVSPRRPRR